MKRIKFNSNLAPKMANVDKDLARLIFNTNVTVAQKKVGILGKVTIIHPAFSTRATIYETATGGLRIQPSSKALGPNKGFFNIVTLTPAFRNHIAEEFAKIGTEELTPWYNKLADISRVITDEASNDSLDIEEVIVSTDLTQPQIDAGIVAKVNLKTSIGQLNGYTVFASLYNNQLYGREQCEDDNNEITGYKLTSEGEAQILRHLHAQIDEWVVVEPVVKAKKKLSVKRVIQEAVEEVQEIDEAEVFASL